MIRILAFVLSLAFSLSSYSFLYISPAIGGSFGASDYDDQSPAHDHNSTNFGFELGLKAGLDLSIVRVGITGAASWAHHDGVRDDKDGTLMFEGDTYDQTIRNFMWGACVDVPLGKSGFIINLEYFLNVDGKVTYSDEDFGNPFKKNDEFSGTGYTIGGLYKGSEKAAAGLGFAYRYLSYDKITRDGTESNFSDVNLSEPTDQSIMVMYLLDFTI